MDHQDMPTRFGGDTDRQLSLIDLTGLSMQYTGMSVERVRAFNPALANNIARRVSQISGLFTEAILEHGELQDVKQDAFRSGYGSPYLDVSGMPGTLGSYSVRPRINAPLYAQQTLDGHAVATPRRDSRSRHSNNGSVDLSVSSDPHHLNRPINPYGPIQPLKKATSSKPDNDERVDVRNGRAKGSLDPVQMLHAEARRQLPLNVQGHYALDTAKEGQLPFLHDQDSSSGDTTRFHNVSDTMDRRVGKYDMYFPRFDQGLNYGLEGSSTGTRSTPKYPPGLGFETANIHVPTCLSGNRHTFGPVSTLNDTDGADDTGAGMAKLAQEVWHPQYAQTVPNQNVSSQETMDPLWAQSVPSSPGVNSQQAATSQAQDDRTQVKQSWAAVASLSDFEMNRVDEPSVPRKVALYKKPTKYRPFPTETRAEKQRVICFSNIRRSVSMVDVSDWIKGGPLVSIEMLWADIFKPEGKRKGHRARVVCKTASHAAELVQLFEREVKAGEAPLGQGVEAALDGEYPFDEIIMAMEGIPAASRRLVLAGKQIFYPRPEMERRLKVELDRMLGPGNIQSFDVLNTGNAHVVLSSVACAIKVKRFINSRHGSDAKPYYDAHAAFAKDLCDIPFQEA